MYRFSLKNKYLIPGVAVLISLLIASLSTKWPYSIKEPGRIVAQNEWSLIEVESGKLISRLISNNHSLTTAFDLFQFDRDDFVNFSLSPQIKSGKIITNGEVVAKLVSLENHLNLSILKGKMKTARADSILLCSGAKPAIQQQAQKELAYARSEWQLFRPSLTRKRKLYNKKLIGDQEMENAENKFRLLQLNVDIAEAKLTTAKTGKAQARIEVANAQIINLQQQIDDTQKKLAAENICCPINGIVIESYQPNVLSRIVQLDTMLIQIPIDEKQVGYIKPGNLIEIYVPMLNGQSGITGKVLSVGRSALLINGTGKFIVIGRIINSGTILLPGMTGYAKISCGKIPVIKLLNRMWQTSQSNAFLF